MSDRRVSSSVEELLLAALEQGGDPAKTGRYLVTFHENATEAGIQSFQQEGGYRIANARDFQDQAVRLEDVGDADTVVFPEIGVALVGGDAFEARSMSAESFAAANSAVKSVDPEYFMFLNGVNAKDYLRGFASAAHAIAEDLESQPPADLVDQPVEPEVFGATWGMTACRIPPSAFSGNGIRVAMLDTGFDMGHPEFAGRAFVTNTFVGQPVADLNGHGTHTTGTACGPKTPPGLVPRYGAGYQTRIFVGKVLTNAGSGTMAGVLAGMNWAIANKCEVISMSLGAQIAVQPAYTNAGLAALNNNLLIIAAAGNASNRPGTIAATGAPANSPTIMSVAALTKTLGVAPFSNGGKVEIAAPGVNVYSSYPRPALHNTLSGTSMATPHVSGVASLYAQKSPNFRGRTLWAELQRTARHLPFPASDVGAGLVQAP